MTLTWLALAALLLLPGRSKPRSPARRVDALGRAATQSHRGPPAQRRPPDHFPTDPIRHRSAVAELDERSQRRHTKILTAVLAGAVIVIGAVAARSTGAVVASAAAPVIVSAVRRLAARTPPFVAAQERAALPLLLDLIAAALDAGAPLADALASVAAQARPQTRAQLSRVAVLLRLGTDPVEAWAGVREHPSLAGVAITAVRSADSGVRLAEGFRRRAVEARADLRAEGMARAHRVGVLSLLPLGLCFLPAFVCLGVVPIIVGIAGDALSSLRP